MPLDRKLDAFDRDLLVYGDFFSCSYKPSSASAGRARAVPCGPFNAVEVEARNLVSRRGGLDRKWNDQAILLVQHEGTATARQYGRRTLLQGGDIYLMDTRASLELLVPDGSLATCIAVSRASLAVLGSRPEAVFGIKIGSEQGFGRLIRHLLGGLLGDRHAYQQDGAETVSQTLQALLAQVLPARPVAPVVLCDAERLQAIKAWILRNLGDPVLCPGRIAGHFGLSRSALYRLFERDGTSPQAWLTAQRLDQARRWLLESPHDRMNVTAICFAAGFNDPSYFSRLMRRRFGCSPLEIWASRRATEPERRSRRLRAKP